MKLIRILTVLLLSATVASASRVPLNLDTVTNAIVGESAAGPFQVKLGIAETIWRRRSLSGVYGYNAPHNRNESTKVWADARRAAVQGLKTNITKGATHFGCKADVEKGTFTGLKLTCILGSGNNATYFFR
jgi:hypothetical protein